MNATKKLAAAILLLIVASAFSITELAKQRKTPDDGISANSNLILYYGNTCPHCKIVEDYLAQNDPANKLGIVQKEVFGNQDNQKEFAAKAAVCKLDLNNLGVPMLWDAKNSKCYEGDQPIIDFLKPRTNQPQ